MTIETRFKLIAINYLAGFFIIDLVSALPLQTIYNLVNKSQESKNLLVVRTLKVLRIVKIVKLRKYNSTVIDFISQYLPNKQIQKFILSLISICMLSHIFSGLMYQLAKSSNFDQDTWIGRMRDDQVDGGISFDGDYTQGGIRMYCLAIYWAA